ncbi:dCTP deaminase [Heterostelium album PN500]|uniref:dCTP deaminase n=1 Tax=Heterostelium pallidum (strain ATCC 26659 / Pp 5 / PN500) TaxID=670386 RepID=D3BNW5_HETP5|nr:dCTP deaminase [Heterostelium album PN500]EFA76884.1 dCTP deaminase [Heterostelium album PN500]|eukprot:XP_020429016.1 dCTP deaminase [Heterostelium album PN500]
MDNTNNDINKSQSLLSDKAILKHMEKGTVVISPFIRENLSTSSYDVTLGPYFYREKVPEPGQGIYNPYSESMVKKVWGEYQVAEKVKDWSLRSGQKLENIDDDDYIIWIKPGETILGHTNEFIGGNTTVTTMMKARSSLGRNFIEVCKCAGWGDVGYTSRWTMEITNNSLSYSIPLVVFRRIAQIIFFDTEGIVGPSYESSGKYQVSNDVDVLKTKWHPTDMLPKMYKDKEIKQKHQYLSLDDYIIAKQL